MKSGTLKSHQSALLAAAGASILLWAIPGAQWAMLPLTYLNTHVHELCHALATQATGGHVEMIKVFANGSGVTPVLGGSIFVLAASGYLGATLVGTWLILASRSEAGARNALYALAGALVFSMVVWVRGDAVGVASGIFWIAAILGVARYARGATLLFLAQFVGVQQGLNSIGSVYDLLKISLATDAHSDARIMQVTTGVPASVWAVAWCMISLSLLTLGLRKAWSQSPRVRTSRAG